MVLSRQVLILVTGSVPGVGKSSLATGLAAAFDADNRRVELFREEDIRSNVAFRQVMYEFDSVGEVQRATLLSAAADYLTSVRERGSDVVVLDALLPYLPSLLAWGYTDDDIAKFFDRLAELFDGFAVLELHLVANPRVALARAAEREGGAWLENHIAKVSRFTSMRRISTLDDVLAFYRDATARSQSLLARSPWPVAQIDATAGQANTLAKAQAARASLFDRLGC
jgi:thymidylate kinase